MFTSSICWPSSKCSKSLLSVLLHPTFSKKFDLLITPLHTIHKLLHGTFCIVNEKIGVLPWLFSVHVLNKWISWSKISRGILITVKLKQNISVNRKEECSWMEIMFFLTLINTWYCVVFEDIGTRGGRSSCPKTELLGTAILLSLNFKRLIQLIALQTWNWRNCSHRLSI